MNIGYAYIEHSVQGGIERASRDLAAAVAQMGHEVHFYCARTAAAPPPGVVLHCVGGDFSVNSARLAAFALRVPRQMRRGNHAITHSHGATTGADVVTAHSCHKAGLRLAAELPPGVGSRRPNFGVADRVRLSIERTNFSGSGPRAVIAVSQGVRRELMQEYDVPGEKITVIPNGVDPGRFPPELRGVHRKSVREALGLAQDAILLLFVGNEFRRKGLELVIRALGEIDRREVSLLVAGGDTPGPYLALANSLGVAERVKFLGNVVDVERLYLSADLFVLPSSYEASSVAVLEAAAAGLPLVLTPVSGTEDILMDGGTGYSVSREPASIALAIGRIMDSEEDARAMGAAARVAAGRFSWDRIAARTIEVYQEVLARRSSAR